MSNEQQIVTMEMSKGDSIDKMNWKEQEKTMQDCQRMLDKKVNTEDFIYAVEQQPAVWDASSEAYSDKQVKLNAWNEIICKFLPDFEQQSLAVRNNLITLIQKKWKSIRSCYTRELLRLKGVKSGSTRKKQYTYFEHLHFLNTTVKKKKTTPEPDENVVNEEENTTPISLDCGTPIDNSRNKQKKRSIDDHELIEVLKKKIASEEKASTVEEIDEDKLFLLSMLTEIHKVPAERKLKLRADIITLVAAAQTPLQQEWLPFGYAGHSNSVSPVPIHQYSEQPQCKRQRKRKQQITNRPELVNEKQFHFCSTKCEPSQDSEMNLQSPPSAATSISANDDSDTQMSDPLVFNT